MARKAHPIREKKTLRIATRGSRLARWQAEWLAEQLRARNKPIKIVIVEFKTRGDRDRDAPLVSFDEVGVFTKEIQNAVLENRADVAVHSMKDLPCEQVGGLVLAAVPQRESPFDVLVSPRFLTLDGLRAGARVGTSSPRRAALLRNIRPDVEVVAIRGNVETRLRKVMIEELAAVVLAEAGLRRLDFDSMTTQRLKPPKFLPAVGQGALAIECRADDASAQTMLSELNDDASERATRTERALLVALRGGCSMPLGAWARESAAGMMLDAVVLSHDGSRRIDVAIGPGPDPMQLGRQAADELRRLGADSLLAERRDEESPFHGAK